MTPLFKATLARLDRPINAATLFICLLLLESLYQFAVGHTPFLDLLVSAPLHALLYSVVLIISTRLDLARLTIAYLALPYLIFIPGWLNTATAIITLAIFSYCLFRTIQATTSTKAQAVSGQDLLAFVLILLWVNLSGVGGYGYQSYDYTMHNARLNDLIDHSWPLRYEETRWGDDKNFVYYMGYFLPAAIVGKLSSFNFASQALYILTLFSVTLALRWLSVLSLWRFSALLVLVFILFGPQDFFGVAALYPFVEVSSVGDYFHKVLGGDLVEFWASEGSNIFMGSFLSNTAQLFWSPPQVIAGWLMMALLTFLYLQGQLRQWVFVYSLLCLWAPLVMIALLPFVVAATVPALLRKWQSVITIENSLGAGTLTLLFLAFYLAGSTVNNPSDWVWTDHKPLSVKLLVLAVFYLFTWGLYTLAISPLLKNADMRYRYWFWVLVATMLVLPLRSYGAYGDLMCRGSAPLMFLLLVYVLRALSFYQSDKQHSNKQKWRLGFLVLLLVAGTASALSQHYVALKNYGVTRPVGKVTDYRYAKEVLGPDNTFFEKYFRKARD